MFAASAGCPPTPSCGLSRVVCESSGSRLVFGRPRGRCGRERAPERPLGVPWWLAWPVGCVLELARGNWVVSRRLLELARAGFGVGRVC